jgi:uncharacterized protein YjiS (DUF1127 family)
MSHPAFERVVADTLPRASDIADRGPPPWSRLWAWLADLNTRRLESRARRAQMAELRGMSDVMLRDLAVDRSEIESIAAETNGAAASTRQRIVARDLAHARWHGQP